MRRITHSRRGLDLTTENRKVAGSKPALATPFDLRRCGRSPLLGGGFRTSLAHLPHSAISCHTVSHSPASETAPPGVTGLPMTTTTESPSPTQTAAVDLADRWWTMRHLRLVIPLGRTALYKLTREDGFPEPVTFTSGGEYYWVPAEVEEWIKSRPRTRRVKRALVASHTLPEQPTLPFAPRSRRGSL